MRTNKEIISIVQQLSATNELVNQLIGDLATERERYLRRSIVAETALKKLILSSNPKLSPQKLQQEFDRILKEAEDDRSAILAAIQRERNGDPGDATIDTLRWN